MNNVHYRNRVLQALCGFAFMVILAVAVLSTPVPAQTVTMSGKYQVWKVNFNGWTGTMEISGNAGSYIGRFNIGYAGWEDMLDLQVKMPDRLTH